MAAHVRLQGGKTDAYTVTPLNQVGPDTATLSIRDIPTYTGDVIFVGKIGADTNAGTLEAAPKLTIQAAITAAVSGSKSYIVIIDSGVYTESFDLLGKSLIAKDGFAPTVRYAGGIGATTATISGGNAITQLEYWDNKGVWLAVCNAGLHYSADLITWTAISSTAGVYSFTIEGSTVYFTYNSSTTYKIQKITTASYTLADYQDLSALASGDVVWASVAGGLLAICKSGSSYKYITGTTIDATLYTGYVQGTGVAAVSKADATVFLYRGFASASTVGGIYGGINHNGEGTIYTTTGATGYIYRLTTTQIIDGAVSPIATGTAPTAYAICQAADFIYVGDNTGNDVLASINNGVTWTTFAGSYDYAIGYSFWDGVALGGSDGKIYPFIDYAIAGSVSTGSFINGLFVDGLSIAPYVVKSVSRVDCDWCDIANGIVPYRGGTGDDPGHCWNTVFHDGVSMGGDGSLTYCPPLLNCIFYNIVDFVYAGSSVNHCVFFNCGGLGDVGSTASLLAKDNIFWNCALPFGYKQDVAGDADFDYNLYLQPDSAASIEMYTSHFTNNPLFVDEAGHDFRLKSKAIGYGLDSLYIAGGAGDSSTGGDLGAYNFTRTLTGTTYTRDYTFYVDPNSVQQSYSVPGYNSATNANGEFSEWAADRDGHLRRTFQLTWDPNQINGNWYKQVYDVIYLYGIVGDIYRFGYSADGTNWTAQRSGTGTVAGSAVTVTKAGEVWGVNRWAGYWVKIDSVYYRIVSSTAKTSTGNCVFTVSGTPASGSQAWQIDYILVRLDKKSTLAPRPPASIYVGETDYNASAPQDGAMSGYTLELHEVDDYDA